MALCFTGMSLWADRSGLEIQKQIDLLPSEGGLITLAAGTYTLDAPLFLRSGVKLCGEGLGTVLKVADGRKIPVLCNTNWDKGDTNIHVAGVVLDGNAEHQIASDANYQQRAAAKNISVVDGVGAFFLNVKNSHLSNVVIRNCLHEGLFLVKSRGVTVENTLFTNCSQNSGKNGKAQGAVYLRFTEACLFQQNQVFDCYEGGIVLGFMSHQNTVLNNRMDFSSSGEGVFIGCGNDNKILSNFISRASHADGGSGAAIAIAVPTQFDKKQNGAARNLVVGNKIEHVGGSGIAVYRADETRLIGNSISHVNENKNVSSAGISLYAVEIAWVLSNTCTGVFGPGISVAHSSGVQLLSNKISLATVPLLIDRESLETTKQ